MASTPRPPGPRRVQSRSLGSRRRRSVNVKLEALKPVYTADRGAGKLTVTSFTPFTEAGRKIDALVCKVVGTARDNTYRSKYMRLVVDDEDCRSRRRSNSSRH